MKKRQSKNPGAFERCVKSVTAKGSAADPRAVCAAAGRKKYGQAEMTRRSIAGKKRAARRNPSEEAAEAYTEFHGRPPDELVEVKKTVHFHAHLAGAGKLERLTVRSDRTGEKIDLSHFAGALLAFNESRTQLFVEGGDQAVDLGKFGITGTPHEQEVLGEVLYVEYFTRKDHLAPEDGGTAIYRHKFESPRPLLIYDVRNEQLQFAGGEYVILPEGIDR